MTNHDAAPTARIHFGRDGGVSLVATRDLEAGDELTTAYGTSSRVLLAQYGVVDDVITGDDAATCRVGDAGPAGVGPRAETARRFLAKQRVLASGGRGELR